MNLLTSLSHFVELDRVMTYTEFSVGDHSISIPAEDNAQGEIDGMRIIHYIRDNAYFYEITNKNSITIQYSLGYHIITPTNSMKITYLAPNLILSNLQRQETIRITKYDDVSVQLLNNSFYEIILKFLHKSVKPKEKSLLSTNIKRNSLANINPPYFQVNQNDLKGKTFYRGLPIQVSGTLYTAHNTHVDRYHIIQMEYPPNGWVNVHSGRYNAGNYLISFVIDSNKFNIPTQKIRFKVKDTNTHDPINGYYTLTMKERISIEGLQLENSDLTVDDSDTVIKFDKIINNQKTQNIMAHYYINDKIQGTQQISTSTKQIVIKNILNQLKFGTHSLVVYINDSYSWSKNYTLEFSYSDVILKLTNCQMEQYVYYNKKDETISASCSLTYNGRYSLVYESQIERYPSQKNVFNNITIYHKILEGLSEGTYNFYITVKENRDRNPRSSSKILLSLIFKFNSPIIDIYNKDEIKIYYKNQDKTIQINYDLRDADGLTNIQILYKFDSKPEQIQRVSFRSDSVSNQNLHLNFPDDLNGDDHSLTIRAFDGIYYSNTTILHFKYLSNAPNLTIFNIEEITTYYNNIDKAIVIYYNIFDADGLNNIALKYDIDDFNQEAKQLNSQEKLLTNQILQIPFPPKLEEGKHIIHIYATDGKRNSETLAKQFIYMYNEPSFTSLQIDKNVYINNIDTIITASGKIQDKDGNENIILRFLIDNEIVNETRININTIDNFSLDGWKKGLKKGDHQVKIIAIDSHKKQAISQEISFYYNFTEPKIELVLPVDPVFIKQFYDEYLTVIVNITDVNAPCKIVVKYQIENHEIESEEIFISDDLAYGNGIEIPKDLTTGNHCIDIWVENEYFPSEKIHINFTVCQDYPAPFIHVKNLPKKRLIKTLNRTVDFDIHATVYHSDQLNISYSLDNNSDVIICSVQESDYQGIYSFDTQNIEQGHHVIEFKACDSNGKCSLSDKIEFIMENYPKTNIPMVYKQSLFRRSRMNENSH